MSDRPPPYPATTKAKGWRFELDYEVVEQSDTWPLAAEIPMCQHALLMMWLMAWAKQSPCGSLPADENLIRAACRIPPAVWTKCRGVLMRGWWLASDGRLYHDTLTKRVIEMMGKRRSDSDRQATARAKALRESQADHTDFTRDTTVTPSGVQPEFDTDHRIEITEKEKEKARATPPREADVQEPVRISIALRKAGVHDATAHNPTLLALIDAGVTEAELLDSAPKAATKDKPFAYLLSLVKGQRDDAAAMVIGERKPPAAQPRSFRQIDADDAAARVAEMTGGRVNARPATPRIFDRPDTITEVRNAPARLE